MLSYNMEDYTGMSCSEMVYALPDTVLQIIKQLGTELGITTIVEPVQSSRDDRNKRTNGKRGRLGNSRRDENCSWDKQPTFKPTELEKKDGVDKIYTEIKGCLNKLSLKNYDTIKASLFEHIEAVFSYPDIDIDASIVKISSMIFDVACINKTFSELYAKLYRELVENWSGFNDQIMVFKNDYLNSFNNIEYVDPDVDYNKYCDVTKTNDRRKAVSIFLVNLLNNNLLSKDEIMEILTALKDKVVVVTETAGQLYYLEELTDVLLVYIKANCSSLRDHEKWNDISSHIKLYASYKAKEHAGLSSRIIFKYMDMMIIVDKSV